MHARFPTHADASLLFIHATGAWSYAGADDDEGSPIVATFEV